MMSVFNANRTTSTLEALRKVGFVSKTYNDTNTLTKEKLDESIKLDFSKVSVDGAFFNEKTKGIIKRIEVTKDYTVKPYPIGRKVIINGNFITKTKDIHNILQLILNLEEDEIKFHIKKYATNVTTEKERGQYITYCNYRFIVDETLKTMIDTMCLFD